MKRHHHWEVQPEWQLRTPGVCFAIAAAIRSLTKRGEAVINTACPRSVLREAMEHLELALRVA